MDVEFKDLTYTVKPICQLKGSKKVVLNSISGRFKSGEFSAILGVSGAGKTSLLNAVSGYCSTGVEGTLLTNGSPRDERVFRSNSCYITQNDLLQPLMTVEELMIFASKLLLPTNTPTKSAQQTISETLENLRLTDNKNTFTEKLSGGEKKRLLVALELINNPPIMFLDEPTSGLDTVSSDLCLRMLQKLAHQGRTIICTIHQPSAKLFGLFDHVYVMSRGLCVYQGSVADLVPFMSTLNLHCPVNYNPADFVIEVNDVEESADIVCAMSKAISNGNIVWKKPSESTSSEPTSQNLARNEESSNTDPRASCSSLSFRIPQTSSLLNTPSQWSQFVTILARMLLQIRRNKLSLGLQLMHHIFSSTLLAIVFYDIAKDGRRWYLQVNLVFGIAVFHTYTWCMVPILNYPNEVKIVKREYFNRWYSFTSYYMALSLSTVPAKIILSMIFLTIIYGATGLPFEVQRYVLFCTIGILTSFIAEALGYTIGSTFNVANGAVLGPTVIAPLTGLAVYGFGVPKSIPMLTSLMMKMSFVRRAFVAMVVTVLGLGRLPLGCSDVSGFCHYGDPVVVLRFLGLQDISVWMEIFVLCVMLVLSKVVFAIMLFRRLK